MKKNILKMRKIALLSLLILFFGCVTHYYFRLILLTRVDVIIVPGKSVWVECGIEPFPAQIMSISLDGVVVSPTLDFPQPKAECKTLGIIQVGRNKIFLPFRTLLNLENGEKEVIWRNPFSI